MNSRIIVGIDVGSTKITTVIGEVGIDGVLDIIGEGTVPSEGLKRGVVVNLERTTQSIRNSMAAAERVAGTAEFILASRPNCAAKNLSTNMYSWPMFSTQ